MYQLASNYFVSRSVIISWSTILQYYMLQEMPMNEVKAYSSRGSE